MKTGLQKMSLAALVLLAACQGKVESSGEVTVQSEPPPNVVAVVNGRPLTDHQFDLYLQLTQPEQDIEDPREIPRKELFREFIEKQLLLEQAQRSRIEISEEEVTRYLDLWLPDDRLPPTTMQDQIREYLLVQAFIHSEISADIEVSIGEIQDYYMAREEEFIIDDQVGVLEILLTDKEEAERLRRSLRSGNVRSFKDAARRFSVGLTATSGGALGTFEVGDLPPDFERVIFALRPGEVSSVFESMHGYHIFMAEERVPRHVQKFHEVQEEIFRRLMTEKERAALRNYLNQILGNASIEIYREDLRVELEN